MINNIYTGKMALLTFGSRSPFSLLEKGHVFLREVESLYFI